MDTIRTPTHVLWAVLIAFVAAGPVLAQTDDHPLLAGEARDPAASVTAFQVRSDLGSSFNNLSDASRGCIVLQPETSWQLAGKPHVARVTLGYTTSGPD